MVGASICSLRTVGLLKGFARLKPGVSLEQTRAEMNVLQRRYAIAHPNPTIQIRA